MANTTNFGWETPDDTDLVKDGAAAMRTLGNSIDTSLVDLKGGTTGQILAKATGTDMDFSWITNDVGDITAVSAGTGISGGGTSGAITITNSMATEITAAGDIIVGTGSGTFDNLPIGTTGQVLTADTTVSPYKVKWATAAGGASFAGVSLQNSTNAQSIPNNTNTKLTYDTEVYDVGGYASGGSTITIPSGKAGYYSINAAFNFANAASGYRACRIYINGAERHGWNWYNGGDAFGSVQAVFNLAVGATVELYVQQNSGGSLNFYKQNDSYCYFQLSYLGA